MAGRREKLRRVGIIPEYRGFTPDGLASGDAIDMTIDELEVLRLCDLEGLNQEAVAQQMGIARATVAAICSRAHRKVANALVNGRALIIEGGNIVYSPITTTTAVWPAKEVDTMRVATTYDNGNIFMHFGRSEQFKIYDIQDGKVLNEQVVGTGGTGHGALAGLLSNGGVDTLICGGIGGGAINALALLCWPCGRRRGDGGVRDVAAFDDDRPSIDQRVCHLAMRATADCRHRGAGDTHVQGDGLLIEALQIAQAQYFELIDRHIDSVSAGKAIGGKAAVFGDDPNAA